MGLSRCNHQLHRFRPGIRTVHLFLLAALSGAVFLGLGAPAGRADGEVDCGSVRLQMQDPAYDNTCEISGTSDYSVQYLEANAIDGSHFLVVIDHMTNFRYVFKGGGGLRSGLKDYFSQLTIDKWKSGDLQQGLRTGEFVSDFKSIPSDCVAFERFLRKEGNGWRRRIIGFGCSRTGDRQQVYDAMRHVTFPE